MAALQGFFLRFKDDAQKAIENVSHLPDTIDKRIVHTLSKPGVVKKQTGPIKPRPVKPLTLDQIDRMVFNPQEGWDKNL